MPPTAGLPVDPATTASERDNRPTAVAEAEAGPQQQPLQRQFVDILQRGLPLDAVFQVEVFLPVPTLLALSATNRAWRHHLGEEAQWRRLFDARWSHCYEGQGRLTVSPSILAALNGNYRSFWGTIEKVEAFMGDYSIVGEDGNRESDSLLAKLFKLLQPWAGRGLPLPFALTLPFWQQQQQQQQQQQPPQNGGEAGEAAGGTDVGDADDGGDNDNEEVAAPAAAVSSSGWGSAMFWGAGSTSGSSNASTSYYSALLLSTSYPSSAHWQPQPFSPQNQRPKSKPKSSTLPFLLHLPPPLPPASWKLACVLRDRAGGGDLLLGCRLCRQLDVVTQRMRREEEEERRGTRTSTQPRTWLMPCRCPALVHRRCLEARVLGQGVGDDDGDGVGWWFGRSKGFGLRLWPGGLARGWISYDSAMERGEELLTAATGAGGALSGHCSRCGSGYSLAFRLPTLPELVAATWQDRLAWKRAGDCILMWLVGVAIVSLSEALYQGQGEPWAWPAESGQVLFWWMFQYVISLHIFFSPRFARVVDLLWLGPIFRFYARLYLYFLLATFAVLLSFTPLPHRILGLRIAGRYFPEWLCALLGWLNLAVLVAITAVVIFLFWKTNYRIPTVADARARDRPHVKPHPMLWIGAAAAAAAPAADTVAVAAVAGVVVNDGVGGPLL